MFGTFVEDYNFTGRVAEVARLRANFEEGVNTILISPRRWGKTSLVRKVCREVDRRRVMPVYVDVFACKSEYAFYNALVAALLRQTASRAELWMENARDFLSRLTPQVSVSAGGAEITLSLGITPRTHSPEEVLALAEDVARRKGVRLMVCIDEFQQVGELPDTVAFQKRLRTAWQQQQQVSYCLFGSKRHLMSDIFQSRAMPLYQFGDTIFLQRIAVEDWVEYITSHFAARGRHISADLAAAICRTVDCYSSYVQQLAWLLFTRMEPGDTADDRLLALAVQDLLDSNELLFMQQIATLSAYQMNFLRALAAGERDFGAEACRTRWQLGSYSNIARLKKALQERDLVETIGKQTALTDPVFGLWLRGK